MVQADGRAWRDVQKDRATVQEIEAHKAEKVLVGKQEVRQKRTNN